MVEEDHFQYKSRFLHRDSGLRVHVHLDQTLDLENPIQFHLVRGTFALRDWMELGLYYPC